MKLIGDVAFTIGVIIAAFLTPVPGDEPAALGMGARLGRVLLAAFGIAALTTLKDIIVRGVTGHGIPLQDLLHQTSFYIDVYEARLKKYGKDHEKTKRAESEIARNINNIEKRYSNFVGFLNSNILEELEKILIKESKAF